MNAIRTVIQQRRLEIPAPDDLPDGTEVVVEITPVSQRVGINEEEWRDDAQEIAAWTAWLDTIEPISFAPKDAFDEQFERLNVEAVGKQMFEESP